MLPLCNINTQKKKQKHKSKIKYNSFISSTVPYSADNALYLLTH